MQLLNKTVESFSSANYTIAALNKAINTTYIPNGNSLTEVINNFTKIQLSRSFSDCGFGQADLELTFNEKFLLISYSSTSGTLVSIWYKFDNNMEVTEIEISIWIPDDRAMSGRCHYECLTEALYPFNWDKVQPELIEMNPEFEIPTPEWYLGKLSNFRARDNGVEIDNELMTLGFNRVIPAIGYTRVWHNPNHYYQYITYAEGRPYQPFNTLTEANESGETNTEYNFSYRRLLELLDRQKDASPVSQTNDIEDYDYDDKDVEYDYSNEE